MAQWIQAAIQATQAFNNIRTRKFEIPEDEVIIKQGSVDWMQNPAVKTQGHLCLTNKRLRYQYFQEDYFSYPLEEIVSVKLVNVWKVIPTGMEIEFSDGRKVLLASTARKDWVENILKAKASLGESDEIERTRDGTVLDENQVAIRKNITTFFNDSELRTLCFDLQVDFENLAGDTKQEKARELLIYCERNGLLLRLLKRCQVLRPKVKWL
jgi:effector-associated domain 7 (EAD7)-containing protein